MDNASKALIMVGAILIAVMLISLGVFLFTYARDKAEEQTGAMDAIATAAFNEQFLSFCGTNIKGASVKSLIAKVQASNANYPSKYKVTLTGVSTASSVDTKKTYKVVESYNTTYGTINKLTVSVNP